MPNVARCSIPIRRAALITAATVAAVLLAGPAPGARASEALASSRLAVRSSVCGDVTDTTRRTGRDVAMSASGTTLVVGAAPIVSDRGIPGRVYVCTLSASGWRVTTILRPSFSASPESVWGAAVAISADGRTIAVGDEYHSAPGQSVVESGMVDVFRRPNVAWQLVSELSAPKAQFLGEFGASVALSANGDRIVVGEPELNAPLTPHMINYNKGAAWLFTARPDASGWEVDSLPLPATESVAYFGSAVAISADGNTTVVGSIVTGTATQHNGHVYVFDTSGATPDMAAILLPHQETYHLGFGETLALSADGSTIAVGAPDDASQGVSVFAEQGGSWVRTATFLPPDTADAARLGQGLALSADGNTLLMTAPYRASAGLPYVGGGYRFVRDSSGWHWGGELAPPAASGQLLLGWSIATSADARYAVLGAPSFADTGGQSFLYLQQDA